MVKIINRNYNKNINLYESIYKCNLRNKDNTNINRNYNKIKNVNHNKRYISNIKNIKTLGTKILSNKHDYKNIGKYILLKIPSNDYLLNLLHKIHISTNQGGYKAIADKYAKEKIYVKDIVNIIYNAINTCPQWNMTQNNKYKRDPIKPIILNYPKKWYIVDIYLFIIYIWRGL